MKRIVVLVLMFVVAACSNGERTNDAASVKSPGSNNTAVTKKTYSTITPKQAMELIKVNKNILVVDVRSPQELKSGKIEGSVLVPFWNIMKSKHTLPKDRPLLLVCAVGGRSYAAMQMMTRQGYTELYNLKGGMDAWSKARLPVLY